MIAEAVSRRWGKSHHLSVKSTTKAGRPVRLRCGAAFIRQPVRHIRRTISQSISSRASLARCFRRRAGRAADRRGRQSRSRVPERPSLGELDKMEFYIPETKETITAKHRPIVIITSNAEKGAADASAPLHLPRHIESRPAADGRSSARPLRSCRRDAFDAGDAGVLLYPLDRLGGKTSTSELSTGSARSSYSAWTRPASRRRSRSSGCSSKGQGSPPCSAD